MLGQWVISHRHQGRWEGGQTQSSEGIFWTSLQQVKMTPFLSVSFEQGGVGVQLYIYASSYWDSLTPSGLSGQDMQVTDGPFFTPSTKLLWIWLLFSTFQPLCHIYFMIMSRICSVTLLHPNSAFGSSEDPHELILSAGFPTPFPTHPTATPGLGSCPFSVPTQERKPLNQWFSTRIGPIPHGVLWKSVDILSGCHNSRSYITHEFHFISG